MPSQATDPESYIESLSDDKKESFKKLRDTIKSNLPEGFEETMTYGMISYVVPHSIYPSGYHVNPATPLPFISIASQKNFIALYHMGLYADEKLLEWFKASYERRGAGKLDMGKSCIRFKNPKKIPFDLLAELSSKMDPKKWIGLYEKSKPKK